MSSPTSRTATAWRDWRSTRPDTLPVSLLAGLTTWVTLLAWTKFAERPAGYMVPLASACLLVAVLGAVLRAGRVPAVLVALVQVVVLLLWLQHRLAPPTAALGGWLPDSETLQSFGAGLRASESAAQTYSSPVPESVPQFYPLLILMGSMTAVLVDFLAIGLSRAPLAGLPLLAAYTAPVSILDGGVSAVKFAAAAMCFLFLIAAQEGHRLARWGYHLTPGGGLFDPRNRHGRGHAIWAATRKIGLVSTGLAVVAPVLVPSVSLSVFGGGPGNGDGNGKAVSISNPMVDLKRDLVRGADINLVTVRTTDPDPSYLRVSVLNAYDGNAWRPAGRDIPVEQRAQGAIPAPPGLDAAIAHRTVRSQFSISRAFRSRWLPTPYPATFVEASGDWRYDRSTLDFISASDGQTAAGLDYRVRSLELAPTAKQLASAPAAPLSIYNPNTRLPRGFPEYVRRLAERVTQGKQTRFEEAVALQDWFRVGGGFRYSLQRASGNGTNQLVAFLRPGRGGRVGYCEQFAAAMAVMGRALGIPSRVAVGFLHPDQTGPDTYVFSAHDLHAWPELYFGGIGWVRFEPTPATHTGDGPAYTSEALPSAQPTSSSAAPSAAASANAAKRSADSAAAHQNGSGPSGPSNGRLVGWAVALLLVAGLLVSPRALRSLVRRRRWTAGGPQGWAEAGWSELRDTARDLGVEWDDSLTLRGTAAALERAFGRPGDVQDALGRGAARGPGINPNAHDALQRLVGLLERVRYARSVPSDATTLPDVRADVETCVAALAAGAGPRRRARAEWLPGSVLGTGLAGAAASRSSRRRRRAAVLGGPGVDRAV
jgi:transglutaminase-like putative cysteine protease